MRGKGHVPIRRCIGCGKRRRKEEMIRLTQNSEGKLWKEGGKRYSGRGFYLCPEGECLQRAKKKNQKLEFFETGIFSHSI